MLKAMLVKKNRLKKILKPFKDQTDKLTIQMFCKFNANMIQVSLE